MAKDNQQKLSEMYKELDDMALALGFESKRRPGCGNRGAILGFLVKGWRDGEQVRIQRGVTMRTAIPVPPPAAQETRYACGHIRHVGGPSDTGGDKCVDCAIFGVERTE